MIMTLLFTTTPHDKNNRTNHDINENNKLNDSNNDINCHDIISYE